MRLSKDSVTKLDKCLSSPEPVPIMISYGFGNYFGPLIFVGHKFHRVILPPRGVTLSILERVFNKALSDNNKKAMMGLLNFAIHHKKTFWRRYKRTALGAQVMANILGQHE